MEVVLLVRRETRLDAEVGKNILEEIRRVGNSLDEGLAPIMEVVLVGGPLLVVLQEEVRWPK